MSRNISKVDRKFKWWVTPLNITILASFFVIIDLSTGKGEHVLLGLDWAIWPVVGLILLYLMNLAVVSKPELAWAVGPTFFLLLSIFLIILDRVYSTNDGWLGLDWAYIPVATLLTFGTIIPTITHLGRSKKTPQQRFEEFKQIIEENRGEETQGPACLQESG